MDAFGERILRTNRFHERHNYAHFVNGKSKGNFGRNRLEYVPIWVIERHMSDEADQLLDLLENGIFDALVRGVLHAVQFTVIADKASPNKVLESYTFTFDNFGKALIRRLRTMCAESPPLPNERSLGIHVFYKPECPESYDVPGFADSQDNTIEYPRTSYWERTRRFYGSVDSGFHTLGLRMNSLLSTSPGGEAYFPSAEEANDDIVLRSDEVGIPTPAQMPLDVVGEIYVSTDESTAGGTDEEEATFPISRDSIHLSQARRESRKDFSPEKYIRRLQTAGSKPTVKASTVDYVENRHGATKKLDEENKDNIENRPGPSSSMTQYGHKDQRHYRCECNTWNFKPRKSIQCANCKDWQHTLCYGYYSAKDERIPDIHYCYSCLIGHEFDSDLIKELIKLIRTRRTIHFVITTGATPTLNWQLAGQLNCTDDEARAAVHNIRKLGIMTSIDGKKMEHYHKLGSTKFCLNQTIPACNTICSEILDPMLLIGEYYDIPPPNPLPLIRSHWSRSGVPIFSILLSESGEWYNTIDPRWQPKLWERVRSNPSANGYFFEGQTSNSVSKRLLDSKDEEGFADVVSTREAKKIKLK
ncbi:hypothetical protein N7449_005485 [Penicillium cf. viridicatum]|uniref:HORMA domain-containing protein n=1 Tax=Penicillium cf. viridicatum TaxID=2972119 RepID=A0A9W9SZA5_9EURO|nr:hypothetical protein N7449_005485 [Penicillium cf. viridicatum]